MNSTLKNDTLRAEADRNNKNRTMLSMWQWFEGAALDCGMTVAQLTEKCRAEGATTMGCFCAVAFEIWIDKTNFGEDVCRDLFTVTYREHPLAALPMVTVMDWPDSVKTAREMYFVEVVKRDRLLDLQCKPQPAGTPIRMY